MSEMPDAMLTFLFTDIEGSTRLWEQSPEAMRQAHRRHAELIRACVAGEGGTLLREKGEGDSTFRIFSSASDAVAAACAVQCALHAEDWPADAGLRVRAALHTGTAHASDFDYNSTDVNRCARLRGIAHGGQTIISQAVFALVASAPLEDVTFQDLGLHRLKDLRDPEHVWQLCHPELPDVFPPLNSLDSFPNNLPRQTTSFIGRDQELRAVKEMLTQTPLLTLAGAGGVGKTRLALQAGAESLDDYPGGVWFVELAALTDDALVAQAFAGAIGLREETGRTLEQTLTDYLASRKTLLLLDNCEHLIDACAALSASLLRACPNLTILATSREPLNIPGEKTWRVPSLSMPDPDHLPLAEKDIAAILMDCDSVRLFVDRARLHGAFVLSRGNAAAVSQVCARLDGIPLALELAAARVRSLPVEQVSARLDDRFRLLTGGVRTALPRQQTLQALIDWSYDLLIEDERLLLRRVSVFAGGWTLEAAEAVCAGDGLEAWQMLDTLTSLSDKSLVTYEEQKGEARYGLLETMRQYGQSLLNEEERAALSQKHWNFFLKLAEEAKPKLSGPEQAQWLNYLEDNHDNLRAALNYTSQNQTGVKASLRLVVLLLPFWLVRGHFQEGRWHCNIILASLGANNHAKERADALVAAGNLAYRQSEYEEAQVHYEESLILYKELADSKGINQIENNLAGIYYMRGDYNSARTTYTEILKRRRETNDKEDIANTLRNLGLVCQTQSDYAQSQAYLEESLTLQRQIGNQDGIATSLVNLANVYHRQGNFAKALQYHHEGLVIRREINSKPGLLDSLGNMSLMALDQGDYAVAEAFITECFTICQELGEKRITAYLLAGLARLNVAKNQLPAAVCLFGAADALRIAIHAPLPPQDQEEQDQRIADVQAALEAEAFAMAWTQGQAMTWEQAVEYALSDSLR